MGALGDKGLWVLGVVKDLNFGAGLISLRIGRIFQDPPKNTAIASWGDVPFYGQLKVVVNVPGDDVLTPFTSWGKHHGAVFDGPGFWHRIG